MGAGKTTVGRELAERLGWRFVDLDAEVEAAAGMSVREIFAREGEQAFREREAATAARVLNEDAVVISPGGGWPINPAGGFSALPAGTFTVWLDVTADDAVRRAAEDGLETRPLIAGPNPLAEARALLAERRPIYAAAALRVDTGGRSPSETARELARAVASGVEEETEGGHGTNES